MNLKNVVLSLLMIFILSSNFTEAKANEKEYNIKNLDMEINLNPNGDVVIQEIWQVDFISGDFSNFYVSRPKGLSRFETYSDFEINEILIDDLELTRTNDIDNRPQNSYAFYEEEDKYYYHWFFRANNEIKKLSINYTLKNVVKKYENEAIFDEC